MSKKVVAAMIQLGTVELSRTAKAVPEDKLNWKPLDNGRTVLDLLGDAAQSPAFVLGIIHGTLEYGPDLFKNFAEARAGWTREEALEHLEKNSQDLLRELEDFSDEKLDEPLTLPLGGGHTLPWGAWILVSYRAMMSRTAQINYIQTLYGDFERH